MNELAMLTTNPSALNTVYNTAYGDQNTLNDLVSNLKKHLSAFDPEIDNIPIIYGPNRAGDVPHSLASIEKAKKMLHYDPQFSFQDGLKIAVKWYWENLNK